MQRWIEYATTAVTAKRTLSFAIGAVCGAMLATYLPVQQSEDTPPVLEQRTQHAAVPEPTGPLPLRIRIPTVSLEAEFTEPLGLTEDVEVEVPKDYDAVGWYQYGPVPGEAGPAVVLGHVDSRTGPAVFYRLGQVTEGDEIHIDRDDGSTVVFEVTGLERPSQDAFPTERVYGNIDHAGVRLITCTGTYDRGEDRYSHNLIVYGKLVRTVSSTEPVAAGRTSAESPELSRSSSPFSPFIDHRFQTLWWLLLVIGMFFGWSAYEYWHHRENGSIADIFLRNAAFSAVYATAALVFFVLGLLELFWWLLAIALAAMAIADHLAHRSIAEWNPWERNRFYGAASLFFIGTALVFSFPAVWWPFFLIFTVTTLPYFVKKVNTQLEAIS